MQTNVDISEISFAEDGQRMLYELSLPEQFP